MADLNQRIDTRRARIEGSEAIDPADKAALIDFSNELRFRKTEYSHERHLKLLQHLTILAGDSEKYAPEELPDVRLVDAVGDDEAAIETAKELVRWIHVTFENEETNRDYRVAVRRFGAFHSEGDPNDTDELPKSIKQISATTSRNYKPMPDPAKMFQWEDHVLPMIDAAHQTRDKALIAMAWDAGFRSGEIRALTIGNIADHQYGLSVTVDGKTGQRTVILIPSVPYVRQWLDHHPRRDDPNAPLWCNLRTGADVSYNMKAKMLKRAARNARMTPPSEATFTRMRKSSASYLASQNVSQVHLENHHGWQRGSEVASRYIAVFSQDTEREIARAHGADVQDDEREPTAPLQCPRCRQQTPRKEPLCVWCGQAMDPQAVAELHEVDTEIQQSLAALSPEKAQKLLKLVQVLDDPEIKGALVESG